MQVQSAECFSPEETHPHPHWGEAVQLLLRVKRVSRRQTGNGKSFDCILIHVGHLPSLSNAISGWGNLHTLILGGMDVDASAASLLGLFRVIVQCKKLENLKLSLKIIDSSVGYMVEMLSRLQKLKTLV